MENKFSWKAEIKFVGSPEEFNKFADTIEKLPIEVSIPEWRWRPHHFAGCMPIPVDVLLGKDIIKKTAEGMPKIKIKYIKDIYGGIRTPHLHLADEVVLLDREKFRTMVSDVARGLAEKRVESVEDYIDVMQPVGHLMDYGP